MSIRKKLFLSVVLVYLVLISIYVLDSLWRQREFTIQESRIQAINYATLLSESLLSWVLAEDLMGIDEVLQSSARMPHIKYAFVADSNGQVIANTDREKVGTFLADPESLELLRNKDRKTHIWRDDPSFIHVAAPLGGEKHNLGWTLVGIDTESMAEHLRDLRQKGLGYTLIALICGAVAAWLLSRSILLQLSHIMKGIRRLRDNDFSSPIQVSSHDEFGDLASALNKASDFLRKSRNQLTHEIRERREAERQIRQLTRRLVDGNEEDRKRLGHDLHDEFGQSLTGLLFGLHALKKQIKPGDGEAVELCEQLINASRRFGDDIRRVAAGQYPEVLERLGLKAEVSSFLAELTARGRRELEISHNLDLPERRLHPRIESTCYRIIQEAIGNALRHGNPTKLYVEISVMNEWLFLRIADNGKGFDADSLLEQSRGIGLPGMRARVLAVDGNMEIKSRPGEGCVIDVFLPIIYRDVTQKNG